MSCNDASALMHASKLNKDTQFDVIDLDPYGSPTPFLDSALQVGAGEARAGNKGRGNAH